MMRDRIEKTILKIARRAREIKDAKLIDLTDELWEYWVNYIAEETMRRRDVVSPN